jgi:hypothetical protein
MSVLCISTFLRMTSRKCLHRLEILSLLIFIWIQKRGVPRALVLCSMCYCCSELKFKLCSIHFFRFKRAEDAKRALQHVNGLEIAGRQVKVGLVNESVMGQTGSFGELDDDGMYFLMRASWQF